MTRNNNKEGYKIDGIQLYDNIKEWEKEVDSPSQLEIIQAPAMYRKE